MSLSTRSALIEDLPILLEFEQGIIAAERPYDPTLKPDPISYYDIAALIADPQAEVAVVEQEGQIIGSGYARRKASRAYLTPAHHAYIGFIYVRPEFRGLGVNRHILDHLTSWSQGQGLSELRLTVYPDNQPALRAYAKSGFEPYLVEMRQAIPPTQ